MSPVNLLKQNGIKSDAAVLNADACSIRAKTKCKCFCVAGTKPRQQRSLSQNSVPQVRDAPAPPFCQSCKFYIAATKLR